ncbi:MAG: FAD-dependent 5-carboxymethylaminomethyl-2-thiouridine(34) oxidoreductase MnmC [Alphaproteobacteria bacterium]|nr:FAD-dependent 5-carboxymethylaminomethyl-2-thiouridine(34) oxidoreductase MnmC [Alphaproteobacteria bacterium]
MTAANPPSESNIPHLSEIDWRDGTPYATRFDDLYFSADDPCGEVQHTFLQGTHFETLCQKPRLTVAETGFGTGLNFLEAWAVWERTAPAGATFDFITVEAFPMPREDLIRAHAAFPHHTQRVASLQQQWPGALPGSHRLSVAGGAVRLLLLIGDVVEQFQQHRFQADAWFMDGFAPAKNPDMWRPEVFEQIARLSAPGATLATFSAAGPVKQGLRAVGFEVEKRSGFGRKRHCLTARFPVDIHHKRVIEPWYVLPPPAVPKARIAVIGDGIAGCATVHALRAAGREPIHIGGTDSRHYAASCLPRALISPKLVRGDQPFPIFWRQAFLDAVRVLDGLEGDIWQGPRGVLMPALNEALKAQQIQLLEHLNWPQEELRHVTDQEAQDLLGRPCQGGIFIPKAGTIDPEALCRALAPRPSLITDIARITRHKEQWHLDDGQGQTVCHADIVILACGPGAVPLLPDLQDGFGLRIGSGQLFNAYSHAQPGCAVMGDGYVTAIEPDGRLTVGSTMKGMQSLGPVAIDPHQTIALRERLESLLPDIRQETIAAWTGLRCDTVDHLPLCGPVQDIEAFESLYNGLRHGKSPDRMGPAQYLPGIYTLTGLGSRGFQAAFLLADHLAALQDGRISPLPAATAEALMPSRFQIRMLRKG